MVVTNWTVETTAEGTASQLRAVLFGVFVVVWPGLLQRPRPGFGTEYASISAMDLLLTIEAHSGL